MTQPGNPLSQPSAQQSTQSFSIDKSIIQHMIRSQAGSLGKGIAEAVMNGVDAHATRIDITINREGVTIEDNGHGFQDRASIDLFFATFGFNHDDQERTFGKFGLGRGQLWAFCPTVYRTRSFEMDVDINARGLDFLLKEGLEDFSGTRITAPYYKKITSSEVPTHVAEITKLIRYLSVPVYVNNQQVNRPPENEKWTHETDDAYIRATESGPLRVYNMGVFVAELSPYQNGRVSGTVVTKPGKALPLNMARSQILESEDGIWKRIKAELTDVGEKRLRASTRLTEADLEIIAHDVMHGTANVDTVNKARLFTDATGKSHSLKDFLRLAAASGQVVDFDEARSSVSDRAHNNKLAFVLHRKTRARFGMDSAREVMEGLRSYLKQGTAMGVHGCRWDLDQLNRLEVHDTLAAAVPDLNGVYQREKPRNEHAVAMLAALDTTMDALQRLVRALMRENGTPITGKWRQLHSGLSDTALAWNDGVAGIVVSHDLLEDATSSLPGLTRAVNRVTAVLIADRNTMTGSSEEDSRDDLMLSIYQNGELAPLVLRALQDYVKTCQKKNLKVKRELLLVTSTTERFEDAETQFISA